MSKRHWNTFDFLKLMGIEESAVLQYMVSFPLNYGVHYGDGFDNCFDAEAYILDHIRNISILDLFNWGKTDEGHRWWDEVNTLWEDMDKNMKISLDEAEG